MSRSILVIAAHPDDDVLGCGGAIARHISHGDKVSILFLADGESSRGSLDQLQQRRESAIKAASCIGVAKEGVLFGDFADNQMDTVPLLEIVKVIEKVSSKIKPELVYTHHHGDLNVDHVLTNKAVLTAFRPMPSQSVKTILGFEVLSSTGWSAPSSDNNFYPQHYIDITPFFGKKLEALTHYENEMRPFPHARSYDAIEALAVYRGAMVGLKKAEAFSIIRQIVT